MIEPDAASREPREGWEAAFREMVRRGDHFFDPEWLELPTSFDEEEWEWD